MRTLRFREVKLPLPRPLSSEAWEVAGLPTTFIRGKAKGQQEDGYLDSQVASLCLPLSPMPGSLLGSKEARSIRIIPSGDTSESRLTVNVPNFSPPTSP